MAPKYTITYFDVAGAAEPVRLALAMTGEEWEDRRVSREEFAALKPTLPFGQVPILEVDGKILCQSLAMLRYVGKLAGIYPADPLEAAQADIAVDAIVDCHLKIAPSMIEKDPEKKMLMRQSLAEDFLPTWLGNLEKILEAAGGEYFAGGKLSIGDIAIVCRLDWFKTGFLDGISTTIVNDYPLLSALMERVFTEPKVAAYRQARAMVTA